MKAKFTLGFYAQIHKIFRITARSPSHLIALCQQFNNNTFESIISNRSRDSASVRIATVLDHGIFVCEKAESYNQQVPCSTTHSTIRSATYAGSGLPRGYFCSVTPP